MYLKAPTVMKVRMTTAAGDPMSKGKMTGKTCRACGQEVIEQEPLYAEWEQFLLARAADDKLAEKRSGPEHSELVMRLRAVIKKGPVNGVYEFETTDGKALRDVFRNPSQPYAGITIHNFAEFIACGDQMSEKDPREAAVLRQDRETAPAEGN